MEKATFLNTKKGVPSITRHNYLYYFHKTLSSGDRRYRCSNFQKLKCKSAVTINFDDNILSTSDHVDVCLPDCSSETMMKFKNDLKRKAFEISIPSKIIAESTSSLGEHAKIIANVGRSKEADLKIIQRQRKKLQHFIKEPDSVSSIPNEYFTKFAFSSRGETWLFYDDGVGNEERIVIFATPRALSILSTSDVWQGDGTFKAVPNLFAQLFTLHAFKEKPSLPLGKLKIIFHYFYLIFYF